MDRRNRRQDSETMFNTVTWFLLLILRILFSYLSKLVIFIVVIATIGLGFLAQLSNVGLWGTYLPPPISHHEMHFPNAEVLAFNENLNLNFTEFRLLVDVGMPEKVVKYATVSFDVRALGIRKDRYSSANTIQMPHLPGGDYCSVNIGVTPSGKETLLKTTSCQRLPGVEGYWHDNNLGFLELEILEWAHSTNNVKLVRHPSLTTPGSLAVMKYAPFVHTVDQISREIQMYRHLQDSGVAPTVLGQVVEEGRVIGFLLEYIADARPISMAGKFYDLALEKCKQALVTLHGMGVKHNNASPENCLIRANGNAVLIDFKLSTSIIPGLPYPDLFNEDFALLTNN
ncbi:hypothetical protein CHU98_g7055 [Xylaria longipes]|nr:hypothetical protein CHU98_g7055 [Xylaria longipes]